jgi:HEAT repeat protein
MVMDNECMAFEEALRQLAAGPKALSSPILYALSAPRAAEVQLFKGHWPTVPVERRREVMGVLVNSAEANFELDFNALLRVTLLDEDGEVRTLSIEGLWEDEGIALIAPLVRILRHDPVASARAAAASSLGRFVLMAELEELDERHAKLIQSALLEAIKNPGEGLDVRRRAVESLAYWGEECVQETISAAYRAPEESMRISAVFSMGRSVDPIWSEIVQDELGNVNPAMRYEAARACGELEVKDAVPALIHLVSDPDREVQFAAIAALGQIGGQIARRFLMRCLQSPDEPVRLAAEDALAELELGQQPLDLLLFDQDSPTHESEEDYEDDELED